MGSNLIISLNERKGKEDKEKKNAYGDWGGNEQDFSEVVTVFLSLLGVGGVG